MYESHWQLSLKPFEHRVETRFYYPAESHQAALLKLRYAIENQRGLCLLSGPCGAGKSLLLQLLSRSLPEEFTPIVRLVFPQMPAADLLSYLADELCPEAGGNRGSVEATVRRLQQFLAKNSQHKRHAVVAVDEAHLLDVQSLEALRLLLNFETNDLPQFSLVLCGDPALLTNVRRLPQLESRLAARCLVKPLSLEETMGYVHHRLAAAGATRPIFDPGSLTALHEAALGNPRQLNRLADLALLVGFAEDLPAITARQIETVALELGLELPSPTEA